MRYFPLLLVLALCSCASAPRLPNSQTASERYSVLGYHEKFIARDFYDLGAGDAIRRLYWAQRASQQYNGTADAAPAIKLQRKYVNLPTPAYQDADGTWHEAALHAVEIVQFIDVVQKPHAQKLFIVK